MSGKSAEQMKRVTRNVTPFIRGQRMFYVECEVLVPHRFLVAVPAANTEAACRLSADVIKAGKAYGIPDFYDVRGFTIAALRSGEANGAESADKIEPIPAEFRRVTRNVSV